MPETAEKYWETRGTKDIANDNYYASKIQKIDTSQWEDYGNAQGATDVITRLVSFGDRVSKPANPTPANASGMYRVQRYNQFEASWETISFPSSWYDCSTWDYYYSAPSYDYVGYFASSHSNTEEKKTVLAQSGPTSMQNFAFDGMEDID